MNKAKKIGIIVSIFICLFIGGFLYFYLNKEDKQTTLTLIEKQWIEKNKNNVIDMSIINDIPILSYNGEGLIVDFLDSLKETTNLSFNKVSYNHGDEIKSEYSFELKSEVGENEILIYQDNYVLLTKKKVSYRSVDELKNLTIGVLNEDLDKVNNYLYNTKASYKTFEDVDKLIEEFNKKDTQLDGIVLLKTVNLKTIFDNNYNIGYNISEYTQNFVLKLGKEEKLNNILTKYYNKWQQENFNTSYNKYLVKNYFTFNNIDDVQSVNFRSKRYVYGFIDNAPYDTTFNQKLMGINNSLLSKFSDFVDIEISYKSYNNINDLLEAFNKNEIDFFYGLNSNEDYALDVYKTVAAYDNRMVVLVHASQDLSINSIKSLQNKNVLVLNNSKFQAYLDKAKIKTIGYDNDTDLLEKIDKDSIVFMDINNYNYNVKDKIEDYIITAYVDYDNLPFVIRDISENEMFSNLFDFYLNFDSTNKTVNEGLRELLLINKTPIILKNVAIGLGIVMSILLIVLVIIKVKPNKKNKNNFTKEDKLRYIDALTSLKNRNYLNDNLEKWDDSELYPQTIVVIDLNNIAYINDNYGHSEGDLVIEQAANILIVNQLENTEIIRTNGNEFLIYMVGYEEKQVITYMRKLSKELKEISHGFGAAIGYSIITDAIKTIDDAINEATLDMRNNKEEANN